MFFNLTKARKIMEEEEIDCLVPTTSPNLLYCSGASVGTPGSAGRIAAVLIPLDGEPVLCLQYNEQFYSRKMTWIKDLRIYDGGEWLPFKPWQSVADLIIEKGLSKARLGFETQAVPHDYLIHLMKLLPQAEFKNSGEIFERLRAVKTEEEIQIMKEAGTKTAKAIKIAFEMVTPGDTERQILESIQRLLTKFGFEGVPGGYLDAGPNIHETHHKTGDYKVRRGDLIHTDMLGPFRNYNTCVSRVAKLGEPDEDELKTYEFARKVEMLAADLLVPGNSMLEIHNEVVNFYEKNGVKFDFKDYGRDFLGHSIGLEGHEAPYIGPSHGDWIVEPGMVIAIEPRIEPRVIGGKTRIHIEDMFLVTEKGPENISTIGEYGIQVVQ
jgi:Xaa-Pro aminopeptidase